MAEEDNIKTCKTCGVKVNIRDYDPDSHDAWMIRHKSATGCKGGF